MYNEYGDEEQKKSGLDTLSKIKNGSSNAYSNGKKIAQQRGLNNRIQPNKLGEYSSNNNSSKDEALNRENNINDKFSNNKAKAQQAKEKAEKAKQVAEKAKKGTDAAKKLGKAGKAAGTAAASGGTSLIVEAAKEKAKGMVDSIKKLVEASQSNEELDPDLKRKLVKKILTRSILILLLFGPAIITMILTAHMFGAMREILGNDFTVDDFSFIDNGWDAKDEVDEVWESAYEKAIKEAKAYCKSEGVDWKDSKATLEDTNSGSWEEVYAESNYIDFCNMMSLIHEGIDYDSYDKDEMVKYLKRDDILEHFYYIDYEKQYYNEDDAPEEDSTEEVTDSDKYYFKITIYPFSEYNLTQVIDKDIYELVDYTELSNFRENEDLNIADDYVDENIEIGESEGVTFDTHMVNARYETIATLQKLDENGEVDEELIEALNGYNETPKYPLVEGIGYYEELEEYEEMDLGQFDTDEWYTEVPVEANGTGKVATTLDGWLKLYDAPTASKSSSSYYVNTALARNDIQKDVASKVDNMKSTSVSGSWCSIEYYNATSDGSARKLQGVKWDIGDGATAVKNDRYLIACGPGIVKEFYWKNTGGIGNDRGWYNYGSKKMDLVVKSKSSGQTYYIPVTTGDSKAHTFPYGISQTGVAIPNHASTSLSGSDFSSDFAISGFGNAKDYGSALNGYSSKLQAKTGYTISQWLNHGAVEWCSPGGGKSTATSRISSLCSKYELLGIIVY